MTVIDKIVNVRPSTDGQYNENFDGLRAVAALMVMGMHIKTIPSLAGGAPGVWIFFTLSGYLLYYSFLRLSGQIRSSVVLAYLIRRVFRIIPLYLVFAFSYAYLFKNWPMDEKNKFFLVQVFFLKDTMHLWTIKEEMIFYIVLPVIIVIFTFMKSSLPRTCLLVFGAISSIYLYKYYKLEFFGTESHISCFLLGMAAVHLKQYIPVRWSPYIAYSSFFFILALCLFEDWTLPLRQFFGITSRVRMYTNSYVFAPLCFLLVMSLGKFSSKFWGNKYLRLIGVVGYGFYLWHPLVIELVRQWQIPYAVLYQFAAYFLTLLLALATYFIIEKPGINYGRKLAAWVSHDFKILKFLKPWWICVAILVLFLSYRQIYLHESMKLEVVMWPSIDTTVQVFIDNGEGFLEKRGASAPVSANQWNKIQMSIRDTDIKRLRFDPGTRGGRFKIKKFKIKGPYSDLNLDVSRFRGHNDIENVEMNTEYVEIITLPITKDPILIYNGNTKRYLTTNNVLVIVGIAATCLLVFLFTMFDHMATNKNNYLKRFVG